MSYQSWKEAVRSIAEAPLTGAEKAAQKGLIHVGKGRYKEKKDGPIVARTTKKDPSKLLAVSPDDPENQPKKLKKSKKVTSTSKNIAGGSPALVPFQGIDPESVEGINKEQQARESQRDQGIAGAGGQKASQGESRYCNALNTLDNDKLKEENATAIEEKKKSLDIKSQDEKDLEALGLSSDSDEGKDYLATREVYAEKELERIKAVTPKSKNVFYMKNGFKGKEEDYKSWMRAGYDGALATRKILKEDTDMDTSKPMTTLQSEGDIDNKVAGDLESKMKAAKTDEDRAYYKNELKEFQHFRKYHDTYTVGVDKKGRTHVVSISNKKGSDLKDPQNNTTPAKRFEVIKGKYGQDVAEKVTGSLNTSIKQVRETKITAARGGTEVMIDDDLVKAIKKLDSKYLKDIEDPSPKSDFGKTLGKDGLAEYAKLDIKGKLKKRNEYVKKRQAQFDEANERLYAAIESGAKTTDNPPAQYKDADGKMRKVFKTEKGEVVETPNNQSVVYNSFGRLFTKLGEDNKNAPKGSSLAQCVDLKQAEASAVSKAHRQVVDDIHKADGGKPGAGEDNGKHAQGYVDTVMDAMHYNTYIDGGDGKMIVQMGIRGGQPSQVRGCLAELSGYDGDTESDEGKEALKNHLRKRSRIDESNGNILIQNEGQTTTLAEDTWRTAGSDQKVASAFGGGMRDCVIGKIDDKRVQKEATEQYHYESLEGIISRMKRV